MTIYWNRQTESLAESLFTTGDPRPPRLLLFLAAIERHSWQSRPSQLLEGDFGDEGTRGQNRARKPEHSPDCVPPHCRTPHPKYGRTNKAQDLPYFDGMQRGRPSVHACGPATKTGQVPRKVGAVARRMLLRLCTNTRTAVLAHDTRDRASSRVPHLPAEHFSDFTPGRSGRSARAQSRFAGEYKMRDNEGLGCVPPSDCRLLYRPACRPKQ